MQDKTSWIHIHIYIYIYILLRSFTSVLLSALWSWCGCPSAIMQTPTTLVVVWALWPHIALRSLDVRMTAIVPQAVVTDNHLGINSCRAISRLYQAILMSCGTAKHVSEYVYYIHTSMYITYIHIYVCM